MRLREVMSWIRAEILPPNASEEELLFSKVAEAALQAAEAASLGGRNGGNRGRGRGGQPKGKGGYQPSGDSGQKTSALVSAMARLIIRHDEQILALSLDVSFVSYARTDQHSVLPQLFAESRRLKSTLSAMPPKQAMAIRFFRELKDCLIVLRGGGMALPGVVCSKSIND